MSMSYLTPTIRLRTTPFSKRVQSAGAKAYTVYNHMLLPSFFQSVEEDYRHLKTAVQLWDVSCQRQVELVGPDALHLLSLTTPRDLSNMADNQCCYIPMVDDTGHMLNDPVAIKLRNDRYWVSLADSDMLYYFKGLASGFGLNVQVFEPDVSPLAIQGPRSETLVSKVFGDSIGKTRFFRYQTINFQGRKMIIARSGWSYQGGFEIYVDGAKYGEPLWDLLFEAGQEFDVRAGGPNLIERIEAGLLSYGNDITIKNTPFEVGLGKYCDLESANTCLAHKALLSQTNPNRQIQPLSINGSKISSLNSFWLLKNSKGADAGFISSATWSPDFGTNVAIGMVNKTDWTPGTKLTVQTGLDKRTVTVKEKFWI